MITQASLEQRIERLECQNRWMKRTLGGVLLVLASVVAMGQAASTQSPEVLTARKLRIVDQLGRERIVLTALEANAPCLTLLDAKGNPVGGFIKLDSGLAGMALFHKGSRKLRVLIGDAHDGSHGMCIYDKEEVPRLSLVMGEDGRRPAVIMMDGKRVPRLMMSAGAETAFLSLNDEIGKARATLGQMGDLSSLFMVDRAGKNRVGLMVSPKTGPLFFLADEKGQPLHKKPD